jgi:hypothetical protein
MTPFLHGANRDWERLPVWVNRYRSLRTENRSMSAMPR